MAQNLRIPKDLRDRVERELDRGERIRWLEQPVPKFFSGGAVGLMLFGIPWTAFALFWTYGAAGFEWPDLREGFQPQYLFALFGIPFILIGLGMLSSPLWSYQAARQTVYAITDARALTIEGGAWQVKIASYSPDRLQDLFRRECRDGTGDVIFSVHRWRDGDGDRRTEELGFKGIRNPREVERLLKQLAETAEF